MLSFLRYYACCWLCVLVGFAALAQPLHLPNTTTAAAQWSAGVQYGTIFKHTSLFMPTVTEPTWLYELAWQDRQKPVQWRQLHGYPSVGLRTLVARFGNADVFGYGVAVVPQLHFYSRMRWVSIQYSLGAGLAYVSQHYHRLYNPTNNVIGSNINNCTSLRLGMVWAWNERCHLTASGSLTHFSNGRTRSPNLGINVASAGVAVAYLLAATPPAAAVATTTDSTTNYQHSPSKHHRIRSLLRVGYGVQQGDQKGGPTFPIYIADIGLTKRSSTGWQLLAGVEANYYTGIYHFVINQVAFDARLAPLKALKVSPYVGAEMMMNHLSISLRVGGYAYNPFLQRQVVPATLGVQYYGRSTYQRSSQQLFVGAYLRTHFANADYFGVGVGYIF